MSRLLLLVEADMNPMNRAAMDKLVGGGCDKEGCDHHDHTMFLHSRCHIDVPLFTYCGQEAPMAKPLTR